MVRSISAAAERNKTPIGDVLAKYLNGPKSVLEIASGTLQHVEYLASRFPEVSWIPSDVNPEVMSQYEQIEHKPKNLKKPVLLDARQGFSEEFQVDLVLCVNMIHISPWEATLGLMKNSSSCLSKGGYLITYGPYFSLATEEAPSNLAFDQSLRSRYPNWGIRDAKDVIEAATSHNLSHQESISMPVNNHMLIFQSSV
ncbi:MAG: DUF938 domain-containing protein [Oligoflexales bacterium]|nr:DUF938 domain-containing protein [Oligoflexales bacterium]